ncbi:MAG: glycosyltransferase, partial [Candidatus Yanofskybacteria bacterium]|nr:glycosyltransferase [Candidatus Yanofskybacteria bacterium]
SGNSRSKASGKNIEFLGLVSDEKLAKLYSNAQACIFPQEEDFGIVPLESMASGRPVIAYQAGGALETIVENKTGIFFNEQTSESIQAAVDSFCSMDFKPEFCREQAEKFDIKIFKDSVLKHLNL